MNLFDKLDRFEVSAPTCQIIGTTAALLASAGISAATQVGGGLIGALTARKAAGDQAIAAVDASQAQYNAGKAAQAQQQTQYQDQLARELPTIQNSQSAMANLSYLLGIQPQGNLYEAPNLTPPSVTGANVPPDIQKAQHSIQTLQDWLAGKNPLGDDGKPLGSAPHNPSTIAKLNAQIQQLQSQVDTWQAQQVASQGANSSTTGPALSSLVNKNLGAFGSLVAPFQAPTALTEQNDPGFKARLALGQQVLENSAAAKGNLLSGGTQKDLNQFAQDYASNEYSNVYNRDYNAFRNQQSDTFNKYATMLGFGAQANSAANSASQNYGNNAANISLNVGNNLAQGMNNAAAARASGYIGAGNAASGALNNVGQNVGNLALLASILKNQTPNSSPSSVSFPW